MRNTWPLFFLFSIFLAACTPLADLPLTTATAALPSPIVIATQLPATETPVPTKAATSTSTLAQAQPQPVQSEQAAGMTVYEVLSGQPETYKSLLALIQFAGMLDTLQGSGPITLFAFKDEYFIDVLGATGLPIGSSTSDPIPVRRFLQYSILPGAYTAADLVKLDGQQVPTSLAGETIKVAVQDGVVRLNDSVPLLETDIQASNGVIHLVGKGLTPGTPPSTVEMTISDFLASDGRFQTLVGLMKATNNFDGYRGGSAGEFTFFAPTDNAFARLPAGTLEGLSRDEQKYLIYYTSMRGQYLGTDLLAKDGQTLDTLLAKQVKVTVEGGVVKLNGVPVELSNIQTRNGVIHVLNDVLMPPK